ncbi:Na+/melibiose symporter-like transporter [Microbacterium terrae]|uniref:Symporter YjmB n=1 Tax=Microbacterium terrae TaxID=69369 RepID=A0A0M2H841_9MICO|nr:MFS transporter [Microbacterium terrae]KJL42690.1 putative symporter YjmB [Microbacterium terrae]MBP1078597.1 Na+/melibiose symporter-like transporter [Microbacterium terrae]GLJ97997.1 MFS transporter [Microbacterium terrae]
MGTDAPDAGATAASAAPDAAPAASTAPATGRLSAATISRYAIGSLGTGGFATLPGLVLTYYLTDSLGVAAIVAGLVITLAKVWDVVIDPVIGALTDRDLARHGTRRRLMVIGGASIPVLFALTFAVPPALGPAIGAAWVFVAFLLTATAFSLFQVPYIALPAELTPRYDERTRLLTWRVVVLTLAILLFGAGGPALRSRVSDDPVIGYLVMGVVAGLTIGIGMLVATTVARRPVTAGPSGNVVPVRTDALRASGTGIRHHYAAGINALRRSRPFRMLLGTFVLQALATGLMLAGAQYVATWVLRSETAVELLFVALIAPALLAAPAWGVTARRFGKERIFAIASTVFAIAAVSIVGVLWAPGEWIYVPVGIAGIAYAGMQSLPMAMLPDVISHDEHANGPGHAGAFSGVWTAGETVGFALGATTLSIILAVTGYVSSTAAESVTQPDAAVTGIALSFSVVPAVLIVLSLLTLSRYTLRRSDIESLGV